MIFTFGIGYRNYAVYTDKAIDISIPMNFNGAQPNTYNVPKAIGRPYGDGTFVGDVNQGSGCNFESYTLIPHCNGTHTECVGHISKTRISINQTLKTSFIPATLITVEPQLASTNGDSYSPAFLKDDLIITRRGIEDGLKNMKGKEVDDFSKALIIRTLPNSNDKKSRNYANCEVPFFSNEAMVYISSLDVEHLLVDLPSVDRKFDEGKLSNHHIFWNVPQGSNEVDIDDRSMKTITEMIYVDNTIEDGLYLLNLQIAPFESDASPSRPLLYNPILLDHGI